MGRVIAAEISWQNGWTPRCYDIDISRSR